VARRDGLNGAGGIFYYFSDHLKTTDIVTDAQGNIKNESDFYPWGGELQFLANDSNHYKFTGKERDSESGLDYFGARYYSNGLGRFITPDWAAKAAAVPYAEFSDPQSLNLYSYVRNVPTSRSDPTGHYEVNASGCGGNNQASCQKKYDKRVAEFEKQRQKDLQSKDPKVRAAAAAYGAQGQKNGVHLGFANLGAGIKGIVDPSNSGKGKVLDVQVTINTNLSGKSLAETIAHEGTHVADDMKFLMSYDFGTGKYDSGLNPYHLQTEFNAYSAGAGVTHEHGFGPNDGSKIVNFIYSQPAYQNILFQPIFPNNAQFPQAQQSAPEEQ
jgi:RHS repeat-associated protein